jgi:hypothetical protein
MTNEAKWEDLNPFRMDQATIDEVMNEARGCTVTYTSKNGHPVGVWVSHAILDGQLHVTTTGNRGKTSAWKRDPRMSAVFAVPGKGSVTVIGRVELTDDPELRHRFLGALADKSGLTAEMRVLWFKHMDTEGRVTGRVIAEKYVTFDERKLVW